MNLTSIRKSALMAALSAIATISSATVTAGSSNAYGVNVGVSLLAFNLNVAVAPFASGSSPSPYLDNQQVLSVNATAGLLGGLSTGLLTGSASSNVDGLAGSRFAMANAVVNNLDLHLGPGTVTPSLLRLTATQITSSTNVAGDFGALGAAGSSVLTNTSLNILGNNVGIVANPAPNTVVFNSLGISVTLNEQILGGNGISSRSLATNAIHIRLLNVLALGGLVNGDVIIAHSEGSLSAVPEPTSIAVCAAGFSALALRRRRNRA